MIITLHTTPPELLLPEWMILGVWNFAGNLTKQNKQQPNTILTLLFSGGWVIYPPPCVNPTWYFLDKRKSDLNHLTKNFWPNFFFDYISVWPQKIFDQKSFFDPKSFLTHTIFWPKKFSDQNILFDPPPKKKKILHTIFLTQKFPWPKIFLRKTSTKIV